MNHKNHELTTSMKRDVSKWLATFDNEVDRCLAQGWMIEQMQHHVQLLALARCDVAKQLRRDGLSIRKLAGMLGISPSRVEQITAK
jgi:hypothetical protein